MPGSGLSALYRLDMALPKPSQITHTHTVVLGDDIDVSFQMTPIPGSRYQQIIDKHRGEDGKTPWETVAVPLLVASVQAVYSSIESTSVPFTEADAVELWNEWPDWARWDLYQAVIAYSTKGPAGNPFTGSKPKPNVDS